MPVLPQRLSVFDESITGMKIQLVLNHDDAIIILSFLSEFTSGESLKCVGYSMSGNNSFF